MFFSFPTLEYRYQSLKYTSQSLERTFQTLGWKLSMGERTFIQWRKETISPLSRSSFHRIH